VAALIALVGVDRVLLGSDYPFEMGDLDPVTSLRATPEIGEDQMAMITEGNFLGLLEGIRR
jgi:aminocarboxymuconate-semialdehyde decarboxylase